MKFVGLVSGGKDSIYSILECMRNGHELVAVIHLGAPESTDEESYMYQTAASEVVKTMVEDCMQVPLLLYQRSGKSINTSLVYQNESENDEVEDLMLALQEAQNKFDFTAVSSGALFSTYQRIRIEHVCNRLALTSLSYLWRLLPQKEMLQKMLEDGIEAVLVRTASPPGLMPRKHLNKTLSFLWHTGLLEKLNQRYQFQVCGEGGEYESLVIDSPLHKKKLVLDEVIIEETDDDVGVLRILRCHAEEKGESDIPIFNTTIDTKESLDQTEDEGAISSDEHDKARQPSKVNSVVLLPSVKESSGGLIHANEIMAPVTATSDGESKIEAELAVEEAIQVFTILKKTLDIVGASILDVMFVHLYLSEISHFASINTHYKDCFGSLLPPSRSCVAVGPGVLPGGRRVLLDCMIQKGSGAYMRSLDSSPLAVAAQATVTSKLRHVLHVQSISKWAPVCVGPYSQSNTLRSSLHFLAGQIGLIPATMQLHPTWSLQLAQCWKNVASVLDALDGTSLDNLFSGLIYVVPQVYQKTGAVDKIESITTKQLSENGSIIAGKVDTLVSSDLYDGYEDEGTMRELEGEQEESSTYCPILLVSIPEMPMNAEVEVEVITLTKEMASSLEINDVEMTKKCDSNERETSKSGWDTGHDFSETVQINDGVQLDGAVKAVGHGCAASVLVVASTNNSDGNAEVQPNQLLSNMLSTMDKLLTKARSGLSSRNVIHVRLFYLATSAIKNGSALASDDGMHWRSSLLSTITSWSSHEGSRPTTTVVPVHAMNVVNAPKLSTLSLPFVALQVLILDPVHMETEQLIFNVNRDEFL
jgi:diphthine-ammonia ligase